MTETDAEAVEVNQMPNSTGIAGSSFREMVLEDVVEYPEVVRGEWRRRTTYGKVRILPIILLSPLYVAALIISGTVVFVCFAIMEKVAEATGRLGELKDSREPEIYNDEK